jgi:sporulation protein YlmC with PRC-barrel domain
MNSVRFRCISLLLVVAAIGVACASAGTSVYSRAGERVGNVVEESAESATVYGGDGSFTGRVSGADVYGSDGSYVGRVTDGGDIYTRDGTYAGRVDQSANCIDRSGTRVGYLESDFDDENAGGACLLLFLLQ